MGLFNSLFGKKEGKHALFSSTDELLQGAEREIVEIGKARNLDAVETSLIKKRSVLADKLSALKGHDLDLQAVISQLLALKQKKQDIDIRKKRSVFDMREKARLEAEIAELERQESGVRKRLAAFEKQAINEAELAHHIEKVDQMIARIADERANRLAKALSMADEDEAGINRIVEEMSK